MGEEKLHVFILITKLVVGGGLKDSGTDGTSETAWFYTDY
jgi:hypothetical protein